MPTIELTDAEAKILTEALQVAEESYKNAVDAVSQGKPNDGITTITDKQIIQHFDGRAAECKRIALKLDVAPKPKRRKTKR